MPSALEAALRRHRAWSAGALVLLTVLAWAWLMIGAGMKMDPGLSLAPLSGHDGAMPGMVMEDSAEAWSGGRFALTSSMWFTMMLAMMLPSAAPTILLYARAAKLGNTAIRPATASFLAGYLIAWGAFSLCATVLQALLEKSGMLGPMQLASQSRTLSAVILITVGLYQLGPIKNVCLRHCRNPAQFLSRHYRKGQTGAVRMGLIHGSFCVGCCWLLMALLFVGGVMNLAWIALLTLLVAAEKLSRHGRTVALATGLACTAAGLAILLGPA